jgi:uncharacterized protein
VCGTSTGACYHPAMPLPPATRAAIDEFAERARARFGDRLCRLVLFGSHARGEATEDSDVDLLLVLDDLTAADASAVDEWVGDLLTRTDVLLSPLVLSRTRFDELGARERRLAFDIERDGIHV